MTMDERLIDAVDLKQRMDIVFDNYVITVDERAEKMASKIINLFIQIIDDCPTIVEKGE
jgi:hypothetical protein